MWIYQWWGTLWVRVELLKGCPKPMSSSWNGIHVSHLHSSGGGHWKTGHLLREGSGDRSRIIQSQRWGQSSCPLHSLFTSLTGSPTVHHLSHPTNPLTQPQNTLQQLILSKSPCLLWITYQSSLTTDQIWDLLQISKKTFTDLDASQIPL